MNERIRKLVQHGVTTKWQVRLAPEGWGWACWRMPPCRRRAELPAQGARPEHGRVDALLSKRLKAVPGVVRTHAVLTLTAHKDTLALPLRF